MPNRGKKEIDITGQIFGRYTVISKTDSLKKSYICRCECGRFKNVYSDNLRSGRSKQCTVCARSEVRVRICTKSKLSIKLSKIPEIAVYRSMKYRCCNEKSKAYYRYGARGIKVCDRWLESFDNFIQDMGYRPTQKHTVERIDNDGNYEPSNCKWATMKEQGNNRCNNVKNKLILHTL